jgi:CRP-like cAMP-binding protein/sugar phosphate permease
MTTAPAPAPAPAVAQPSAFAVFHRRSFSLLWTGQFVSTIGDALLIVAAGIVVFRLTGSALSVGLMLIATMAPALVVGLIAGVYVDRLDRKKIMIAADLLRAAIVVLMPLLLSINIVLLYLLVALATAVSEFFNPALDATLPEIAPDEELGAANALMAISSFGSTAVGFAAGGLIAALGDVQLAFYIDAATFVFSAACTFLATIPKLPVQDDTTVEAVAKNLKDGLRTLASTPILRSLLAVQVVYALAAVGVWNALLLPFSLRALHATTFEYGLQEALTSVGFVIGSLIMAQISMRIREGQWLVLGYIVMGLTGIAYGLTSSIVVAIAVVGVSGFANAFTSTAGRLIRQRNSPREFRGRVMSTFSVIGSVFGIIGMALAGLADVIDIRLLVVAASVAMLVIAVLAGVLPGLGQPAAQWRRAAHLLRTAPAAGGLTGLRPVTITDLQTLIGLVPTLAGLERPGRDDLMVHGQIGDVATGARVVTRGEVDDKAYFVLSGKAVAGAPGPDGEYRSLSSMEAGDFFGEIAALTGTPRTADVVAEEATTLLEVPASTMRHLMSAPGMSELVLGKMSERLARTSLTDLPKFGGVDQSDLRELRTRTPAPPTQAAPAMPEA